MCHQSRAPVPTSEVILVRLRVAPTRPPRASSTARDATIFPPPHPPLHARLARSRASTTVPSRAADHPARSSTLARARVIIHRRRPRPRDDDDERDATRRANTRAHAPTPFPSLARIASHRLERDAPTTPRARVMRRPPRARRLGSPVARGADEWPRRGDRGEGLTTSHDRPRTIARTRGEGFDRSIERSVASIDRQGTTKTDHCHIHTDRRPLCPDDGPLSHT